MKRLWLMAGFAAGYVLGARAGRHRYDQIAAAARQVRRRPELQQAAAVLATNASRVVRGPGR